MLSLKDHIDLLENDLKANPPRVNVHTDLPFAILQYMPVEEWEMRRQVRLLVTRLAQAGKRAHLISLADLLWEAIEATEGLDAIVELEKDRGFSTAQRQVTTYLSKPNWHPLPQSLAKRLESFDPDQDIVFLMRAAAMAPSIYHMSALLDEIHDHRVKVTTILFYPGTLEGTTGLRFMDMKEREALGNYRVKIYGSDRKEVA